MLWHAADEYIKYYLHQFDLNIDILLEIAPLKYLYFFKILKSSTFLGISMTTVLIFHINPDLTKQTPTASLLYNLPNKTPGGISLCFNITKYPLQDFTLEQICSMVNLKSNFNAFLLRSRGLSAGMTRSGQTFLEISLTEEWFKLSRTKPLHLTHLTSFHFRNLIWGVHDVK